MEEDDIQYIDVTSGRAGPASPQFLLGLAGDDLDDDLDEDLEGRKSGGDGDAGDEAAAFGDRHTTTSSSVAQGTSGAREESPAQVLTLEDVLSSARKEAKTLAARQQILTGLLAEESRLFSPDYRKSKITEISELFGLIRAFSAKKRAWKKDLVAEHMVRLYHLLEGDAGKQYRSRAASDFLKFISDAIARMMFENNAANASKKRKEPTYNAKPGEVLQLQYKWDPSKKDAMSCPKCGHWTVMKVEVIGGKPSKEQIKTYNEEVDAWNRLPNKMKDKKTKPTMKSLGLGKSYKRNICMCCVMSCTNGSGSCPHCATNHPGFALNGACLCSQCQCQCDLTFDASERAEIARRTLQDKEAVTQPQVGTESHGT